MGLFMMNKYTLLLLWDCVTGINLTRYYYAKRVGEKKGHGWIAGVIMSMKEKSLPFICFTSCENFCFV